MIILITDGDETCGGDGVRRARQAFEAGFPVYVISFGRGATNTRALRNMAQEGGTNNYYQADDGNALIESLIEIVQRTTAEGCDGRDNDCDGLIDERLPPQPCETMCGRGEKICVDGQLSNCTGGDIPADECDGIDNDCDNLIDETGYGECVTESGNPGTALCLEGGVIDDDCTPDDPTREEICDGRDNNENGEIDENTDEECSIECHLGRRRCVEGVLPSCSALQWALSVAMVTMMTAMVSLMRWLCALEKKYAVKLVSAWYHVVMVNALVTFSVMTTKYAVGYLVQAHVVMESVALSKSASHLV